MKLKNLSTRLTMRVAAITLVMMFIAIMMSYLIARQIIFDKSIDEMSLSAAREAEKVNNILETYKTVAKSLSTELHLMDEDEIIDYLKVQAAEYEEFISTYVGFSDGVGIFSDDWIPESDWNASQRPWYIEAKAANGETIITAPYIDSTTGDLVVTVARYAGDYKGREAVVAIDVFAAEVAEIVRNLNINEQGYATLFDNTGMILAHTVEKYNPTVDTAQYISDIPGYDDIKQTLEGGNAAKIKDEDGLTKYVVSQEVGSSGWYLDIAIPESAIFKDINVGMIKVMAVFVVLMIISFFVLAMLFRRMVATPVNSLVTIAEDVAHGEFKQYNFRASQDEIGVLYNNFNIVIDVVKSLVSDLRNLSYEHTEKGDIDAFIDENEYSGYYREVVKSVNEMASGYNETDKNIMECLNKIVSGEFSAQIDMLPGKKAYINEAIEDLRSSLRKIDQEVGTMTKNVINGDMQARIDVSRYKGDWAALMSGLNNVLQVISEPISEILLVMQEMARGSFSVSMTSEYKGDFETMKTSINGTVSNISEYIRDISHILDGLANNDFSLTIDKEYIGEFANIKNSLESIIENLNIAMKKIGSASNGVMHGATDTENLSKIISNETLEQAQATDDLKSTISYVREKSSQNAQSANRAVELSDQSHESAEICLSEMKAMLESMDNIKDTSVKIERVVKAIEDISFQTNLLALNASIEAARAGEHGRGFAVVAGEVRNLATRSQTATLEILDLMGESNTRVNRGIQNADATSGYFDVIVSHITEVSDIISEISKVSEEQLSNINSINKKLLRIAEIATRNSESSEKNVQISSDLSEQSENLTKLLNEFKVRG